MEEKKSCCCKSFPKLLWWLLTLLGLPLLYFLMFSANKDPIETDLSQRVMGYLEKGNMAWAEVDVDERGRDVFLRGIAPNEKARDTAIKLAKKVKGVRTVDSDISFPTEDMDLKISLKDGKMTLDGNVASQKAINSIVKAAVSRVGEANVTNNLVAKSEVKPSSLLSSLPHLLSSLPDDGIFSASTNSIEYAGTVSSDSNKTNIIEKARMFLNPSITVVDKLIVKELKPMSLTASIKDGEIVLEGIVSSQAEIDSIVKAAVDRVGKANVTNKLTVSDEIQSSSWLSNIPDLMALVTKDGLLSASADGVKLTGNVDSNDKKLALLDKAKTLLESFGIPVINGLTVVIPEPAVVETPEPKAESVVAEVAPEPKSEPAVVVEVAEPSAIVVCQGKLDKIMSGKSVHFSSNKASIKQESFPLLKSIAKVMEDCQNEIANGISINGYTDSRGNDDYNMALSLRRAEAVKNYLVKRKVKASLLKSVGHGETNPVADNATREGRAQNRRITFIINK